MTNGENAPEPEPEPPTRRRGARLYHTKSRTGCVRCKARRVKCDEQKPRCGSCARHDVSCVYHAPVGRKKPTKRGSADSRSSQASIPVSPAVGRGGATTGSESSRSLASRGNDNEDFLEEPESESRRLLELKLLQNYYASVNHTTRAQWSFKAPWLALEPGKQNLSLLYAIFSWSAVDILYEDPENVEMMTARQRYLTLAIQEHRQAVVELDSHNLVPVFFTSFLLLTTFFANLGRRELEPYSPPMEWLQMGRGVKNVFKTIIGNFPNWDMARIGGIFDDTGWLDDVARLLSEEYRRDFMYLMQPDLSGPQWRGELLDPEIRIGYEKTVGYIGSCYQAFVDGEANDKVSRRLLAFAVLIPAPFVSLVAEQRPRAMVILAHFFALAARIKTIWFMRDIGEREIRAISKLLYPGYQQEMYQCYVIGNIHTANLDGPASGYSVFTPAMTLQVQAG